MKADWCLVHSSINHGSSCLEMMLVFVGDGNPMMSRAPQYTVQSGGSLDWMGWSSYFTQVADTLNPWMDPTSTARKFTMSSGPNCSTEEPSVDWCRLFCPLASPKMSSVEYLWGVSIRSIRTQDPALSSIRELLRSHISVSLQVSPELVELHSKLMHFNRLARVLHDTSHLPHNLCHIIIYIYVDRYLFFSLQLGKNYLR